MVLFLFGQFFQRRFRPGAGQKDAFHRRRGEGAVADGALQGSAHVGDGIDGQQGQDLVGLVAAVALAADEPLEEAQGGRPQRGEALLQLGVGQAAVGLGMMGGDEAALAADVTGQQRVAGDLFQRRPVGDQFRLGQAHGQESAELAVRDGIAVAAPGDEALGIDGAVHDTVGVVGAGRHGQQVRQLFGVALTRRLSARLQDADVGDVGQPPRGDLVEVLQGLEGAAG